MQVRRSSSVRAYYELMKPRIVYLLDFTAVMAFLVAASNINVVRLVAVVVAGTLASGGAGALNCYIDRDVDRTMGRTSWETHSSRRDSLQSARSYLALDSLA